MKDIVLLKNGTFYKNGTTFSDGNQSHLIFDKENFEAIIEVMPKGTVGCFFTFSSEDFLFDYIIKGKIEIRNSGETAILNEGDCYHYSSLKRQVLFRILEDTKVLSINTNPCYDQYQNSVEILNDILNNLQKVDTDTLRHCTRVKEISLGIAYFYHFDESQILDLFYASKFHDVGKSKIPIDILLKPARLTHDEYEIMKKHSRYTYEMIKDHYNENVANIAFEHHEHLDGSGYPRGIKGDEISDGALILAVADAFDAMVVDRPYRKAMTHQEAISELRRCQGKQFDEKVIDALEEYLNQL